MKAEELMLGGFFRVNKDGLCIKKGTVVRVVGIDGEDKLESKGLVCAVHCHPLDGEQFDGGIWLSYLEPIPITPEILKKNGFVEIKYPSFSDPKDIFYEYELPSYKFKYEKEPHITDLCSVTWCDYTNRPYILSGGPTCDIRGPRAKLEGYDAKYIHELQAAMRLCGMEEEIIL